MARPSDSAGTNGTRAALLAAARSRFATVGFDGARLTDLCADAALTTGALYRNFASKEALLEVLVVDLDDDLGRLPATGSTEEVCTAWLDAIRRHRGAYRALVERSLAGNDPGGTRRRIRNELSSSLTTSLSETIADGALSRQAAHIASDTLEYTALAETLGWTQERASAHVGATLSRLLVAGVYGGVHSEGSLGSRTPARRRSPRIAPVLRWAPGPGRATPGSQRGRDQVEAVLDAAEVVFAEVGVAGTTVADIAVRAGVSSGTVYRYFTDKVDVLACLLVRVEQNLYDSAVLDIDDDGRFDALDGALAYLTAHRRHLGVFRAWRELAVTGHELARAWVDVRREFARGIESVVIEGVLRGVVDASLDATLVGDLVVAMFEQTAHVRHELGWDGDRTDAEAAAVIAWVLGEGLAR